jgi:hypothetical protein
VFSDAEQLMVDFWSDVRALRGEMSLLVTFRRAAHGYTNLTPVNTNHATSLTSRSENLHRSVT